MNLLRYNKVSFSSIMEALQDAQTFQNNEVYLKNTDTGEIHKVQIEYVGFGARERGDTLFDLKINEVEMGGVYLDIGEAYDMIKSCVGGDDYEDQDSPSESE